MNDVMRVLKFRPSHEWEYGFLTAMLPDQKGRCTIYALPSYSIEIYYKGEKQEVPTFFENMDLYQVLDCANDWWFHQQRKEQMGLV